MQNNKIISFRLSEDIKSKLKRIKESSGLTYDEIIGQMAKDYAEEIFDNTSNDTRVKIKEIVNNFEHGLYRAGLKKIDEIDYDILAEERTKCWNNLKNLISN